MADLEFIDRYREEFLSRLEAQYNLGEPKNLYEPIAYILALGGKRLRPVLSLMGCELFGARAKDAMGVALAIETFHNFSLVHDDIMDRAPLRRGQATVHEKWDLNTGILSGDALLILAYRFLEEYPPELYKELTSLFSQTALEVCQGQQYDMDFGNTQQVSIPQYLKMIEYKTAVLLAAALKMGALVGGAGRGDAEALYRFGLNLGIAFQIQDDYLDLFGDPDTFGKQLGGDVLENKKTFLYLKALELSGSHEREELLRLYSTKAEDGKAKIEAVRSIFGKCGSVEATKVEMGLFAQRAFESLDQMELDEAAKSQLIRFGEYLIHREL